MNFRNRQKGMGFVGWLMLIVLFGAVLTVGLKLVPIYGDHNTMMKVIENMAQEPGMAGKPNADLLALLKQRFKLNNIREFDLKKNILFDREKGETKLNLVYEVRMPLIYNLDLVAHFKEQVTLRN